MKEEKKITIYNFNKNRSVWKLDDLKIFCKNNNLSFKGRKKDIIDRIDDFINEDIDSIEKKIAKISLGESVVFPKDYVQYKKPIKVKLKTIYFDSFQGCFYMRIKSPEETKIEDTIGCFKEDNNEIKKDIKSGKLYKGCTLIIFGYYFNDKKRKVYNMH